MRTGSESANAIGRLFFFKTLVLKNTFFDKTLHFGINRNTDFGNTLSRVTSY